MKDGLTRKLPASRGPGGSVEQFLREFDVRLVAVSGPAAGSQHSLSGERLIVGRGPGVDAAFDDRSLSRQHAAIEFIDGGLRVRDLGSTNGVRLNGMPVQSAELQHGDQIEIGTLTFQLVVERQAVEQEVYELPIEA